MFRAEVVHQCYRTGGGRVWVRKRRGGWRTIRFGSGPGALAKLLGLASVLSRIGGATTTVAADRLTVTVVPAADVPIALVPRAGPAALVAAPNAP